MNLPWVARSTLEAITEERDRLRSQVDQLLNHLTRIDRAEHGLSEVPREQKPPLPQMPKVLLDHINGYAGGAFRKMQRDRAYARALGGESWEEIMADVMGEESDE